MGVPFLVTPHACLTAADMAIPNRGPELLGVNTAFIVTAFLAYSLRCFVRVKMVNAFGFDDCLMGIALVRKRSSS